MKRERERELVGILVVSESMETRERVTKAMLYWRLRPNLNLNNTVIHTLCCTCKSNNGLLAVGNLDGTVTNLALNY
jgi:hypothetical protein